MINSTIWVVHKILQTAKKMKEDEKQTEGLKTSKHTCRYSNVASKNLLFIQMQPRTNLVTVTN